MTIATRLASTALLALLSVAMAVPSCATAGPIAVKCGLQDIAIAASDYAEIAADVRAKDWTDLAKEGEKIGWATLDCVLGAQVAKDGSIKGNVDEFRRLKSVEFRAAGVSASNDSPANQALQARVATVRSQEKSYLSVPVERGGTVTIRVDAATGMSGALPIGLTDYNDVACADFSYKQGTNELLSVRRYYCESI